VPESMILRPGQQLLDIVEAPLLFTFNHPPDLLSPLLQLTMRDRWVLWVVAKDVAAKLFRYLEMLLSVTRLRSKPLRRFER
jgi:hypothetical protein